MGLWAQLALKSSGVGVGVVPSDCHARGSIQALSPYCQGRAGLLRRAAHGVGVSGGQSEGPSTLG